MKLRSHSSRGVASIIGGVFLVLIILSAYAFFMMSNQQTDDLQSTIRAMNAADDDKMQEKVVLNNVVRNGTNLRMNISNQGPKDVEIKYVGWINEQKSNTTYTYTNTDLVISPGASTISNVDVDNATGKYQIKVISESGNIYTATYPFVSQSSTSISLCKTNGSARIKHHPIGIRLHEQLTNIDRV